MAYQIKMGQIETIGVPQKTCSHLGPECKAFLKMSSESAQDLPRLVSPQYGASWTEYQRILGHTEIKTTMIYVNLAGIGLREAHAKASPVDRLLSGV